MTPLLFVLTASRSLRAERRRLTHRGEFFNRLTFDGLLHILLKKVVEERPYGGDGGQLPDLLPRRRDGAAHDVGGQLELKPEQQPHAEAQPDRSLVGEGVEVFRSCASEEEADD